MEFVKQRDARPTGCVAAFRHQWLRLATVGLALISVKAAQASPHPTLPAHHIRFLLLNETAERFLGAGNFARYKASTISKLVTAHELSSLDQVLKGGDHSDHPVLMHGYVSEQQTLQAEIYTGRRATAWIEQDPATWFLHTAQWVDQHAGKDKPAVARIPYGFSYPNHRGERYAVGMSGSINLRGTPWDVELSASTVDAPLARRTHRFHSPMPGVEAQSAPVFGITLSNQLDASERKRYGSDWQTISLFSAIDSGQGAYSAPVHVQMQISRGPVLEQIVSRVRPEIFSDQNWDPLWQRIGSSLSQILPPLDADQLLAGVDTLLLTHLGRPQHPTAATGIHLALHDDEDSPIQQLSTEGPGKDIEHYFDETRTDPKARPHAALEERMNYVFVDQDLLRQALTTRSWANEYGDETTPNYERLEFLGDSFIGHTLADAIYTRLPNGSEQVLTDVRGLLNDIINLSRLGRNLDVGNFIYLGHGDDINKRREDDGLLKDVMQALAAAVERDAGYSPGRAVIMDLLDPAMGHVVVLAKEGLLKDPITLLIEYRKKHDVKVKYRQRTKDKDTPTQRFAYEVEIDGVSHGTGSFESTKHAARRSAAKVALQSLGLMDNNSDDDDEL